MRTTASVISKIKFSSILFGVPSNSLTPFNCGISDCLIAKVTSYARLLLVTNHTLQSKTHDQAFYRRIICVPFKFPITPQEMDVNLLDKLWQERDYIVTAAIDAYFQLKNRNYVFSGNYEPNLVVVQDENNIDNESLILKYLHNSFEVVDNAITFIEDAYKEYLKSNPNISLNVFLHILKHWHTKFLEPKSVANESAKVVTHNIV